VDDREHLTPGAKFYEWERKGVPIRLELGPKDLEKGQVVLVHRVEPAEGKRKAFLPEDEAMETLPRRLEELQDSLLAAALRRREENSRRGAASVDELEELLEGGAGFVYTGWSGDPAVEEEVKARTKATIRCIPDPAFRSDQAPKRCVGGGEARMEVVWARAY
jgi:prolyl-tRNA synthetase